MAAKFGTPIIVGLIAVIVFATLLVSYQSNIFAGIKSGSQTTTQGTGQQTASQISVEILDFPATVEAGKDMAFTWKVNAPSGTKATHTGIHYGPNSISGPLGTGISPANSGYPTVVSNFLSGSFDVPNSFSSGGKGPTNVNKIYFRAHAIIDGKNYWSDEKMIIVTQAMQTTQTVQTKEFTIEADDSGFYPSSTINVNKNNTVKITFKVRSTGVYYGGLDFRSSKWNTVSASPGGSATVQFVADSTFTFSSYWPSSGVKKADGQIIVA